MMERFWLPRRLVDQLAKAAAASGHEPGEYAALLLAAELPRLVSDLATSPPEAGHRARPIGAPASTESQVAQALTEVDR